MGADRKLPLTFPALPNWPPTHSLRGVYIHWWLCLFMTGVGALKAAGKLRHDLSRIAGVLELLGGLVFLPCWKRLPPASALGPSASLRLGSLLILAGLGVIVSTKKRKSLICWSQVILALELLHDREGFVAVAMGVAAMVVGTLSGLALQVFLETDGILKEL
eukprot:CAMPEP_0117558762 /NCGR_PEP_ID=MMETSP0784-20121206/53009_1 /TAXON_ID=39447 /ORGANISM="" /LENGTH=161 /DNA_ID=CAMNT_0005356113 /DNA_START=14 /DNA_END=499 /DNA_ORIENTATION=+